MHSKQAYAHGVEDVGGIAGVVSAVTLGLAFTLLALGIEQFWVVFVVGFGVVLPMATGWADREQNDADSKSDPALAELQHRYAKGELTDEEFEHRVEQLLVADEDARRAGFDR